MDGKSDTNLWRVSREAMSASIDNLMGAENTIKFHSMKKMAPTNMKTPVLGTVLDIRVTLSRENMPLSLEHCKRLVCCSLKLELENSNAKGSRKRCVQWPLPLLPTMKCMRRLQKCRESLFCWETIMVLGYGLPESPVHLCLFPLIHNTNRITPCSKDSVDLW